MRVGIGCIASSHRAVFSIEDTAGGLDLTCLMSWSAVRVIACYKWFLSVYSPVTLPFTEFVWVRSEVWNIASVRALFFHCIGLVWLLVHGSVFGRNPDART